MFPPLFFVLVLLRRHFLRLPPPTAVLAFMAVATANAAARSPKLASLDLTLCQAFSANALSAIDLFAESEYLEYDISCSFRLDLIYLFQGLS